MTQPAQPDGGITQCVAILAPRGRDAAVARDILTRQGVGVVVATGLDQLAHLVAQHAAAVLMTEEALAGPGSEALASALAHQPSWSDIPFIVLANGAMNRRSEQATRRMDALRNAVLLSRPLHAEELVRSVRSALTARARQHEARERMEELQLRERQLYESEAKFHGIANFVDQMIWSTLPDGFHDYFNYRWYEFTGVEDGSTDGTGWSGMFHPDDQKHAWEVWRHSLATGEPYEVEYRLRHRSGGYRWVLGRAQPLRDANGKILRWYGTCTDIHERKVAEEQRQLMLAEMNHRVKNSMAMVHAIVSQSLRQADSLDEARASIQSRISMMAQAHDRLVQSTWTEARMHEVVSAALAPHSQDGDRISIEGPDLPTGSKQALALTMALHELATNAAKYGALSTEAGRVLLRWQVEDTDRGAQDGAQAAPRFHLTWHESGGPKVEEPSRQGFGSRMIEEALAGYFSGSAELDYAPDGLRFTLDAPLAGLTL